MTELNIKNLTYSIGDKTILDNISFSVSSGEVVAVVGKNGVGKTTLLNNILEKLNTIYPDTVKVEEFVNMLNADDERGVYQGIINLIYENQIEVYSEKVKIKKAEKLKLNKKYRKYIEYIMNTENPVISLAAFNGNVLHVSRIEMEMMLLFDGKRTDKDIADIIKKNAKNEGNEKEIEEKNKILKNELEEYTKNTNKNLEKYIEENSIVISDEEIEKQKKKEEEFNNIDSLLSGLFD